MSIASARRKAGVSQVKLAKELGVTGAAVCLWEKGRNMPRAALLPKIAEVLGCSIDDLLKQDAIKESCRT